VTNPGAGWDQKKTGQVKKTFGSMGKKKRKKKNPSGEEPLHLFETMVPEKPKRDSFGDGEGWKEHEPEIRDVRGRSWGETSKKGWGGG